jgi:hypothetical protein
MDAKITKKRLNDLLSYDWIKIIALIIAGIVLWSLIFTMTAVRLTVGQHFKIFLYYDIIQGNKYSQFTQTLTDDILSYDVLDFSSESLLEDSYGTILSARFSVSEGDLMIITDAAIEETETTAATNSNFKSFVDSYGLAYPIEELIADAENYYKNFYELSNSNEIVIDINGKGTFKNHIVLKEVFKDRMDGDNRYKTDEQIEKGLIQELNRIETLRKAVIKLKDYITAKPEYLLKYNLNEQYIKNNPDQTDVTLGEEKAYGIKLNDVAGITNIFKNKSGGSENLSLIVLNWKNKQPDLQYEVIPVIVNILEGNFI